MVKLRCKGIRILVSVFLLLLLTSGCTSNWPKYALPDNFVQVSGNYSFDYEKMHQIGESETKGYSMVYQIDNLPTNEWLAMANCPILGSTPIFEYFWSKDLGYEPLIVREQVEIYREQQCKRSV